MEQLDTHRHRLDLGKPLFVALAGGERDIDRHVLNRVDLHAVTFRIGIANHQLLCSAQQHHVRFETAVHALQQCVTRCRGLVAVMHVCRFAPPQLQRDDDIPDAVIRGVHQQPLVQRVFSADVFVLVDHDFLGDRWRPVIDNPSPQVRPFARRCRPD